MLQGVSDPLDRIANTIHERMSEAGGGPRRRRREALPRKLTKALSALDKKRAQGRYVPYRTRAEVEEAEKLSHTISRHLSKGADRKDRARQVRGWFARLIVNYLYFAVALAGFWYVATQM